MADQNPPTIGQNRATIMRVQVDNMQFQAQVAQLIANGAPLSLQGPNNVEIRHVGSNISGNAISAFMDALFYSLVGLYCYDLGSRRRYDSTRIDAKLLACHCA